ncbi:pyrroline-5-carboxylate reductase [Clostridium cylindrosporum]|uniref:Pyrroline-5-carboxylate reductase n=1 Tax=Clostridium cylindrosporum DSM 605 TaxID=1121307 RepID=A0A0J8G600_CLOCY|nr:pyrroline-5-carboxylate reductase [Clostridium cylindrosporum]KMT23041.1 pyrroline-5-carboxylate reductase ProC [Clostridium cylindrosporum DSM 605]
MIGFIGAGNMGFAIIKGMINKGISPKDICVYDKNKDALEKLNALNIDIYDTEIEVSKKSKYLFIAVKPNIYDYILNKINTSITEDTIIISIAAGYEVSRISDIIGNKKIVRTMPNTPALCGEGFTAAYFNENISESEKNQVLELLKTFGKCCVVEKEELINSYSAVSGSGPAYVSIIIEAMADAAVLLGVPRSDAYILAEQTILGTAKLALDTNQHPAILKDMVCSPGGTTIEGVRTLEEKGFRSALIECIVNTYKKNIDIKNIR